MGSIAPTRMSPSLFQSLPSMDLPACLLHCSSLCLQWPGVISGSVWISVCLCISEIKTALSHIIVSWPSCFRGFWLSRLLLVSFRGFLAYELFDFRALGTDSLLMTSLLCLSSFLVVLAGLTPTLSYREHRNARFNVRLCSQSLSLLIMSLAFALIMVFLAFLWPTVSLGLWSLGFFF
jgi:hypothetical protein